MLFFVWLGITWHTKINRILDYHIQTGMYKKKMKEIATNDRLHIYFIEKEDKTNIIDEEVFLFSMPDYQVEIT